MDELVKASIIRFDLPFMIKLPDGNYNIYFDEVLATINLKRTRSPSDMPGLPLGVKFPDHAYIEGDRWGRFNYTKIVITFHHPVFLKPSFHFPDFLFSKSIDVINRLLNVCRGVKGDHYIRITGSDIFSHEVFYIDQHGKKLDQSVFVAMGGQVTVGFGTDEPSEEQLLQIKKVLETDTKLPLFQELILDASDYHFYRNYKAAVIESETAFEVFVDNFILRKYRNLGLSESKIKSILESGLKNLLTIHIKKTSGFDFGLTHEYDSWNNHAYKVRNDVVHDAVNVSDVESAEVLNTVTETIKFLISKR